MKKFSKEEMTTFIKESKSIADVCRKCGWLPKGANYKVVKKYINEYNLDVSHFNGYASNINNIHNKQNEKSLDEILKIDSYYNTNILKYRLIKESVKQYKCEKCGISEWNCEQISLQLHHINGNSTDNRIENLQLLCPNCHSQTDSYCGNKNLVKEKKYYCNNCNKQIDKTKTGYCNDCYQLLIKNKLNVFSFKKQKVKTIIGYCSECKKELYHKNDKGLCLECFKKTKPKIIDKESLEQLIKEKNFCEIGRMFNVSDNAVRKWCKKYGLPYRKKDF